MRIVIDLQAAQGLSRFRGIGRYSLSLALAMVRNRGDHEIIIALNGMLPESLDTIRQAFEGLLPPENIRVWNAAFPVIPLEVGNEWRRKAAQLAREAFLDSLKPDVVHVTSIFEGLADNAVHSVGLLRTKIPTAVTFYDLIPLIEREKYLFPNADIERFYLETLAFLRNADLFLAISESSKCELVDHQAIDADKIVNISAAADAHFVPVKMTKAEEASLRKRFDLTKPFLMYSGATDERKNHKRLIEAFAMLPQSMRQSYQLAIVGKISDFDRDTLGIVVENCKLKPSQVVITGQVSDKELIGLYNICELFVFPSWHEGFGLPALEAMSCGAPVIAANTTSLPEVVGHKDAYFDPFDVTSIAEKIETVLGDPAFRSALSSHGLKQSKTFSWDRSARLALKALEDCFEQRSAEPEVISLPVQRRKLAFVSPLPPERTGIADYAAELLPELALYYDLYLITPQPLVKGDWLNKHCRVRDVRWFEANMHLFERVIYQFGNSTFHSHMFDLLARKPGIVVLHDFFLSGGLAHVDAEGAWMPELYRSHGYVATREMAASRDWQEQIVKYPCNATVIRNAVGVIVHSEVSRQMADAWLGKGSAKDWTVVPLLRDPQQFETREAARQALNLSPDAFVISTFGLVDPTKQSRRLLDLWLETPLSKDPNCSLVFVGENHGGDYGDELNQAIYKNNLSKRVKITGWTESKLFQRYLAASDMAVQLRAMSRGETSAAVLDCMKYGLPTIVNANGSMASLPKDAVYMLPDAFDDDDLKQALVQLWQDKARRDSLGKNARAAILTRHSPRVCGRLYADAIERDYASVKADRQLIESIGQIDANAPEEGDLIVLSEALAQNLPPPPVKQLLVDVSALVATSLKTGVERVVSKLLLALITNPPVGFRVEPVYADASTLGYRYARQFTMRFLNASTKGVEDAPIETFNGDVFLGLDLQQVIVAFQEPTYKQFRKNGVYVYFVVYDLLPVLIPDVFPPWSEAMHANWLGTIQSADGVICISRSVADEMKEWMSVFGAPRVRPLQIGWFHLGAEIADHDPKAKAKNTPKAFEHLKKRPSFLMVGTIEPRKGHLQTIQAFETLWKSGVDANLFIVGAEGWTSLPDEERKDLPKLIARLKNHPELNKRLFWLTDITDNQLELLYGKADCLIAASLGEGFGLPIIEAAHHGLPVIARDLSVFREVAAGAGTFFKGRSPDALSDCIAGWLTKKLPKPVGVNTGKSWDESARDLLNVILGKDWYAQSLPDRDMRYWPGDKRLFTEVAVLKGRLWSANGKAGYLVYGPGSPLEPGNYNIVFHLLRGAKSSGQIRIDVTADNARVILALKEQEASEMSGGPISLPIFLEKSHKGVEFRVWVDGEVNVSLSMIEVTVAK